MEHGVVVLRKIGNSVGMILPKGLLDSLRLKEGDELCVIQDGSGLFVTPSNPDLKEVLDLVDDGMRDFRHAMNVLSRED